MRLITIAGALLATGISAHAADYANQCIPYQPRVIERPVAILPRVENVRPLIEIGSFWSEVKRSESPEEVFARAGGRFGPLPLTFQGINTETGQFSRVTILRAYRRSDDQAVDLPNVTFDVVTDGVIRRINIPLLSITGSRYR